MFKAISLIFSLILVQNTFSQVDLFNRVSQDYGDLIIKEGTFRVDSHITPWSSSWFPARDRFLFARRPDGEASPLGKYDVYVMRETLERRHPGARQWMEDRYDPSVSSWFGLCDAWALASIMAPEPTNELTIGGSTFRVSDLKALLVLSYEGSQGLKQYGQRFYGAYNFEMDGHPPRWEDIAPDQFHLFMQKELFEKGLPFLMDYDPGVEVWTVPVYKAKTEIVRSERDDRTVLVTTTVFYADSQTISDYDYVGTKTFHKIYEYELYGHWDYSFNGRGDRVDFFKVESGSWINGSLKDHPDYLIPKPQGSEFKRSPLNPNLKTQHVDRLLNLSRR